MSRTLKFAAFLAFSAGLLAAQAVPPQTKKSAVKPQLPAPEKNFPQQAVDQPALPPKPMPLRPSQMPAVAPRISYQAGQLTVVAENSTFADVISSIRNATQIPIETVGGPSSERIAVQIGPAPVKQVLLALMEGSNYDFYLLGSETDPNAVSRVVLTPRMAGAMPQPSPQPQPQNFPRQQSMEIQNDDGDDNEGFATPVPPAQRVIPPDQQAPAVVAPSSINPNNPNQPKTPEQLMEELKRLEQQRQQQQNVNPGQPVPTRPTRPGRDR